MRAAVPVVGVFVCAAGRPNSYTTGDAPVCADAVPIGRSASDDTEIAKSLRNFALVGRRWGEFLLYMSASLCG